MAKNVQLAERTQTAVAANGKSGRGLEQMNGNNDDLIIPRAKLLQDKSPELENKKLKAGMIVNNLTQVVLDTTFVPILAWKEYVKFSVDGIEWKTLDPADERVQKGIRFIDGEKPEVTQVINFLGIFGNDYDHPVIVSFSRTSYKAGRKLYSMAKFGGGDLWSTKYRLFSKEAKQGKYTYFVFDVEQAGAVSNGDVNKYSLLYNNFKNTVGKVSVELEAEVETDKIPF